MSMSLHIFTTREQVQIQEDKIEIWTPEEAAVAIIYPKVPIGPWNKLYKTELIRNNQIDFNVPWSGEGHYFSAMAAQYANHVAVGRRKVYNYRLNNAESGLTHYNVNMGINALWNTKNIENKLVIKTPRLKNAIDYHIWAAYHFILKLIIATGTQKKYQKEYHDSIQIPRKMLMRVLIHSEVSFNHKIKMILMCICPVFYAKRLIKKEQIALKKDLMK